MGQGSRPKDPSGTSRAPAAATAGSFALGAALGLVPSATWSLLAGVVLLVLATLLTFRKRLPFATALVLAGFFFLGDASQRAAEELIQRQGLLHLYRSRDPTSWRSPVLVEGRLLREPVSGAEKSVMALSVERVRVKGRVRRSRGGVRVRVDGDRGFRNKLESFHCGDTLRAWVVLRRPRGFLNPGAFDINAYYARNGWILAGSAKSALLVERSRRAPWWRSLSSRLRAWVRKRLDGVYRRIGQRESEAPGVVLALLVGDRAWIPSWAELLYQSAGTLHVIAISGAHVGLLTWLLYGALRKAGLGLTASWLALFLILPMYASLCGGRPSVVRAVLMCLCVLGAKLLGVDPSGFNGLALSALILLVFRPMDLRDPGFQLSFAATATILVFASPMTRGWGRRLGCVGRWLGVSLAAQAGAVPILAWHFMRLTPAAVAANLVAMPLAGALIVMGGVLVVWAPVPWIGDGLAWAVWALVKTLSLSSRWAVSVPGGSLRVPPPEVWWMASYAIALVAAGASRGKRRWVLAMILVGLTLWLALRPSAPTPPSGIRLTAFDVGHGDALLLELPGNRRVLVDGGGSFSRSFDIGEAVLVPALLRQGVRRLDAVVVTHADFDHIGGLPAVFSNLRVAELWEAGRGKRREGDGSRRKLLARLRKLARSRGSGLRRLWRGEELVLGQVRLRVLSPVAARAPPRSKGGKSNEGSLVLLVSYGRARLLLTGDAGRVVERRLVRGGRLGRIDVLKVGHHGSRSATSPLFLDTIRPRVAVISTGSSGFVHLPSPDVLLRLSSRGVRTFRTDRDGAVSVTIDQEGHLSVETVRGGGG